MMPPDVTRHTVPADLTPLRTTLLRQYLDVQRGTARLISSIPSDKWDYSPGPGTMTVRQLVHHMGEIAARTARGIVLGDWQPGPIPPSAETSDDRGEAIKRLDHSIQETLRLLADVSDAEFERREIKMPWGATMTVARAVSALIEHDVHHRTQLFLSLKLSGAEVNTMSIFG